MTDSNATPRRLRRDSTPAERRLWERLRDRRLEAKFRRQHPVGRYVVDFACVEARLVVELEGGVHRLREAEDAARRVAIRAQGWRVLVVSNEAVFFDLPRVLEDIRSALRPDPHPDR